MFDMKLVETFIVVAHLEHFGRAAEALHATQPGVSKHIARLERQLGVRLFERDGRSVRLTTAGATFLRRAEHLVGLASRMEDEVRLVANGLAGELRVGLSSSAVYSDIPTRLGRFKSSTPDLVVTVDTHPGDELQELLDHSRVDAIFTTLPPTGDGYLSWTVSTQPIGVALPSGHRLASAATLSLEDLRDEDFIVVPHEKHPQVHDALVSGIQAAGRTIQVAGYEVPFPNLLARVALGEGIGLVPLAFSARPDGVGVVPLRDDVLTGFDILLIIRGDGTSAAVERLVSALVGDSQRRAAASFTPVRRDRA